MKITRIWAKNFLSFKDIDYTIPQHPIRLTGKNLTEIDQESVGSGKSGIAQIIEYSTKGTNSRKETVKGLIRDGFDKGECGVDYYCGVRQAKMCIRRVLLKSKTEIFIDFGDGEKLYSSDDAKTRILEWLDLSGEDLDSYFFINKERFKSFFDTKGKQSRLDLLERISKTESVNKAFPKIKEELDEIDNEIKSAQSNRDKIEGKIEEINEQIEDLNNPKEKQSDLIKSIDENIAEYRATIKSNEESIESLKWKIKVAQKAAKDAKRGISKLEGGVEYSIDDIERLIEENKDSLSDIKKELDSIELNLNGAVTCPNCNHEFSVKPDVDLDTEREIKAEIEQLINELTLESSDLDKKLAKEDKRKDKIYALNEIVDDNEDVILRTNRAIERLELDNESTEVKIKAEKANKEHILASDGSDNSSVVAGLKTKVKTLESDLMEADKELSRLNDKYSSVDEWNTNFKKFKMFIANKQISSIQNLCNVNLRSMSSDLRLKIDGYRTLSNGKDKEEITPYVVREREKSFYSYSGGEKAKVEFAMIMTIQQLINKTNRWGGLDFLIVDEIFEGLDALGIKYLMKSIEGIGASVMLITHVPDDQLSVNTVTVIKENGISRIEINN